MDSEILHISYWQLALSLVFVVAAGATSIYHGLKLERSLAIGVVRTFVQLFLLGYVLKILFHLNNVWLVLGVFTVMILFAAHTIRGRVKERRVSFFRPVFVSMLLTYSLVTIVVSGVVVGADPWWKPQYFIPLAGMVAGNSMNAIAIAIERLLDELKKRRPEIEMMLSLGADYREASQDMVRQSMRAGMIPSINSMVAAGIVFIPGMMTGQILAGVDPTEAVLYQIMVMVMLVGSTALGSLLVVLLVRRRCFTGAHQLILRPGKHPPGR